MRTNLVMYISWLMISFANHASGIRSTNISGDRVKNSNLINIYDSDEKNFSIDVRNAGDDDRISGISKLINESPSMSRRRQKRDVPSQQSSTDLQNQSTSSATPPPLDPDSDSSLQLTEVGTSVFYDLAAVNDVFVDKSLFIEELLKSGDKVLLITRPSKWGKTINMDMVKTFVELDLDENGNPLPPEESDNRKLFVGGEIILEDGTSKMLNGLKIANDEDTMRHQGGYPTIFLTFKNIECGRYDQIENTLKKRIRILFLDHGYLDTEKLNAGEKEMLNSYLTGNFDTEDLKCALPFLSRLLKRHFNKHVYILIDNYDAPITHMFVKMKDKSKKNKKVILSKQFRQTLELLRAILNECFNGNEYLKQGFITGVLRIQTLVSGLNNFREYNLLDEKFSRSYGFTEPEVDSLFEKFPCNEEDGYAEEVKRWLKGYRYGKELLYNPWSIMQSLKNKKIEPYWLQTDVSNLIEKSLIRHKYRQDIRRIMLNEIVLIVVNNQFDFDFLNTRDGLFNILLFTGYLTPVSIERDRCNVSMPNEEIRTWYEYQIK